MRQDASATFSRHPGRDDVAVEAVVNREIGVGGDEVGVGDEFGEAYDSGVGEAHGDIGILVEKMEDGKVLDEPMGESIRNSCCWMRRD